MKQFGRKHRPYFRICAMDIRRPRDGRVLEQLGTYDPLVPETDARAVLNGERIAYWLSVGARPSDKVQVLIKKYGASGTHLAQQKEALDRLAQARRRPEPPPPMPRAPKPAPAADEGEAPRGKGRHDRGGHDRDRGRGRRDERREPRHEPAAEATQPAVEASQPAAEAAPAPPADNPAPEAPGENQG
jgi:small subunit ribosomal protein S16